MILDTNQKKRSRIVQKHSNLKWFRIQNYVLHLILKQS